MNKKAMLVLMVAFSALSVSLFAGGFALSGVGSRATAMGGAFRGLSDDASAMYWNPAGLAFQDGLSMELGGTFVMPSAHWESPNPNGTGLRDGKTDSEKALKAFPNAFITLATHPKLKYGLGVFVPYGLGSEWDLFDTPPVPSWTDFPEKEISSSIAVFDVHPTIAYQILPNLSAGAGFSIMYGSIDLAKFGRSENPAFHLNTTKLSGTGFGYGANMGLMFKPTSCLALGLTGKLPAKIKMKGDTKSDDWNIVDASFLNSLFDTETTLNIPAEAAVGISFGGIRNLVLNLDYAYTMWDVMDKVTLELATPMGTLEKDLNFDWENTMRISLGGEYDLNGNKLRAGVYFDQSPVPESTQTPALSDIGNKISANIGYGRMIGPVGLDLNFQYVNFAQREVKTQSADNVPGSYNAQSLSGNIGLSYRF